ncbi:MAG TPA: hypothetical protein VMM13_05340 [Euzebya sp.]|nr:hypothetical protein [Euzebya sp.]
MTTPAADRGAAAVTGVMATVVALVLLLPSLVAVAGLLATARSTRSAADAAALAVLSGSPLAAGSGVPDTGAGHDLAAANGARLVSVDPDGWPMEVSVTVTARPAGVLGDLVGDLTAHATARLVPP